MDNYEYEGVYNCYGCLCVSMAVYRCLREYMAGYSSGYYIRIYG